MLQTDLSSDHFSTFNTFFREMLGDLTDYDELDVVNAYALWVFFFIASLVLSIVLLNLLIAIISDTFGNVKSNEDLARHFEMCNIIYDIDAELMVDKPTEYYMIVYAETGDKDLKNPLEILKEKIVFSTQMVKNIDYHLEKVLNKDGGSGYSVNHPSKKKKVA